MSFFDSDRYPSHKFKKDIVSNIFMLNILYPFEKTENPFAVAEKQKQNRLKTELKRSQINNRIEKQIENQWKTNRKIKKIFQIKIKKEIELLRIITQQNQCRILRK